MAVKKKETTKADVKETKVEEAVETTVEEPMVDEPVVETSGDEATIKETTEEVNDNGGDVTLTVDSAPEAPIKMVKIKPNCDYRFYYGTTWYALEKDVIMTVPEEVKIRLQGAGKLSTL